MKKIILCLSIPCILIYNGCNSLQRNSLNQNADSLSTKDNKKPIGSFFDSIKFNALKKQILGVWLIKGETATDFEIRKDSIFYIDQNKSFKYILNQDDTLVIYFDGYVNKSKVLINKDTLILKGDNIDYFIRNK